MPLRIAFCITELNVGGAERCLVELAIGLKQLGHETSVCCLGPRPVDGAARLLWRLGDAQVPVSFLGARGPLSAPRVLQQLRRQFRAERPDIVQTFLWHANVLGPLAAWSAGIGRIVTGLRVAEPRRRSRWPLERFAGRLADRHVAVSEGVAAFARDRIGLPAEKIVVIPNGVSLDKEPIAAIDLSRFGISAGRRAIAFVGRLDEQKGIEWLVERSPDLFARLPHHDLLIVGKGPLEAAIARRVERLRLAGRVHLVGWREDVSEILAAADLIVAPSQWEGMSNVVLEAMAVARPVVAFDVEGVRDALGANTVAQIVDREDRSAFVESLVRVAANESLQQELGATNRKWVEAHFRLDRMIAAYERLYLELCE
ncbi:MAG TPA: glycosyltransferase [Pirellulales bacterium]|jgi:glycosyltransferase involved in cell wall biosynthesis|nr:glycosyltransferase [Pirellulales bacterium]